MSEGEHCETGSAAMVSQGTAQTLSSSEEDECENLGVFPDFQGEPRRHEGDEMQAVKDAGKESGQFDFTEETSSGCSPPPTTYHNQSIQVFWKSFCCAINKDKLSKFPRTFFAAS